MWKLAGVAGCQVAVIRTEGNGIDEAFMANTL
jgi:hypothetical protein